MKPMTKEELIKSLKSDETWDEIEFTINKFFEQNVCIPKGQSRHPYADVLHEYYEDTSKTLQYLSSWNGEFKDCKPDMDSKYRIKPSEPVYEWQWTVVSQGIRLFTDYLTDAEFKDSSLQYDYWNKMEETKRERK